MTTTANPTTLTVPALVFAAKTDASNGRCGQWHPVDVDAGDPDWRAKLVAAGWDLSTCPRAVAPGAKRPRTLGKPAITLDLHQRSDERDWLDALPDADWHELDLDRVVPEVGDDAELARAVAEVRALLPELGELRPAWSGPAGRGVHLAVGPLAAPTLNANWSLAVLAQERATLLGWAARRYPGGREDGRFRRVPGTGWELDVTKLEAGGRGGLLRLPGGRWKDGRTRKTAPGRPAAPVPADAIVEAVAGRLRRAPDDGKGIWIRQSPDLALTEPARAAAAAGLRAAVPSGLRHNARMALADVLLAAGVGARPGVAFLTAALGDPADARAAWATTASRRASGQRRLGRGWLMEHLAPDAIVGLTDTLARFANLAWPDACHRLWGPMRRVPADATLPVDGDADMTKATRLAARCGSYEVERRCTHPDCGASCRWRTACDQRICMACAGHRTRCGVEAGPAWLGEKTRIWTLVKPTFQEAQDALMWTMRKFGRIPPPESQRRFPTRTFTPCDGGWRVELYEPVVSHDEAMAMGKGRPYLGGQGGFEVYGWTRRDVPTKLARAYAIAHGLRAALWLSAAARSNPDACVARWRDCRRRPLLRRSTDGVGCPLPTETALRAAAKARRAAQTGGPACEHEGVLPVVYDVWELARDGRTRVRPLAVGQRFPVSHAGALELEEQAGPAPPPGPLPPRRRRVAAAPT